MTLALGVEIGGTKLQVGVGSEEGKLRSLIRRTVDPAQGGEGIREVLPSLVDQALAESGVSAQGLSGIGVGFGGPVDSGKGRVLVSHQIEGWSDFPLRDWLSDRMGLPVVLQNDAKTAALAEAKLGAGKGLRRIFYITIGSGIGGGLVVDGQVDVGQGLGAGEIGHTWVPHPDTGEPEKLELVASGWSIGKRARARMGETATAASVYAAAEKGDPYAKALLEESAEALAIGISNVIALLCPERVILGGGVSLMGPLFWDPLRAKVAGDFGFKPFAGRTQIVPSALGEEVVVIGAVLLGLGARR
ncbi:MAG TPA: ROK family protein [Planctomycetota bacterium]|nr:ROK family protein [Planctomycetota bacterium]